MKAMGYREVVPPIRCYGTGLHARVHLWTGVLAPVLIAGGFALVVWDAARKHGATFAETWAVLPPRLQVTVLAVVGGYAVLIWGLTLLGRRIGARWPVEVGIAESGLTVTYANSRRHVSWEEVASLDWTDRLVSRVVTVCGTRIAISWRYLDRAEVSGSPPSATYPRLLHRLLETYVEATPPGIAAAVQEPPLMELRAGAGPWWVLPALLVAVVAGIVVPGVLGLAGLLEDGWAGAMPFLLSLAGFVAYALWLTVGPAARTVLVGPSGLTVRHGCRVQSVPWGNVVALELRGTNGLVIDEGDARTQLVLFNVKRVNLAAFAASREIEPRRMIAGLRRRYSAL